jgi:hypothetical protein
MLRGLNKTTPGCDPGGNLRRSAKSRSSVKIIHSIFALRRRSDFYIDFSEESFFERGRYVMAPL